jgi:hypothetical protein
VKAIIDLVRYSQCVGDMRDNESRTPAVLGHRRAAGWRNRITDNTVEILRVLWTVGDEAWGIVLTVLALPRLLVSLIFSRYYEPPALPSTRDDLPVYGHVIEVRRVRAPDAARKTRCRPSAFREFALR